MGAALWIQGAMDFDLGRMMPVPPARYEGRVFLSLKSPELSRPNSGGFCYGPSAGLLPPIDRHAKP
jgi:hypothetical protein